MANIEDDMSLDDFKRWTVESLKCYLRKRGLNVKGNKETLVARAYVAWEMKLMTVPTTDEYKEIVKNDYSSLLACEEENIPDPYKLSEGWLSEKDGIQFWPPTMVQDIGM